MSAQALIRQAQASGVALRLVGGKVKAMRFTREATAEFDTRGDVWLAPEMDYLPVRIRLTQANGDFLDLLWKSTEKP